MSVFRLVPDGTSQSSEWTKGQLEGSSALVRLRQSQEAAAGLLVWSLYQNISWPTDEQRATLDFLDACQPFLECSETAAQVLTTEM